MAKSFTLLEHGQRPQKPLETIDWSKCIFCQETTNETLCCPGKSKRPDIDVDNVYTNLVSNLEKFQELGILPDVNLAALDDGRGIVATLKSNEAKWHKKCRDRYNNTKAKRAEKRKIEAVQNESVRVQPEEKKVTRNSSGCGKQKSQDMCFFCGKSGDLHRVSTNVLDKNIRQCAHVVKDFMLIGKLSAGDMVSQRAMYHSCCLQQLQRKAEMTIRSENEDIGNRLHGIALAELISYIGNCRAESKESAIAPVFKLRDLAQLYTDRLKDLGADKTSQVNCSRLKERILAQIPDLQAYKQGRDILLAFKDEVGLALKKAVEIDFDEEATVLARAAEIVRRDILQHDKSAFTGSFSKECQQQSVPQSLMTLVGMIMTGPDIVRQSSNATDIQAMLSVSQLVRHNVIIRRREGSISHYHSVDREPPLPIYVGLLIHAKTRKRGLIDKMYDLGLSISYDRVLTISKNLGNEVCARYEADHVVCPTNLRCGLFTTSAVDNIDHNPSSTTAQGSFHGTGISVFQHTTRDVPGEDRNVPGIQLGDRKQKKMTPLPEEYTNIHPQILNTKELKVPEVSASPHVSHDVISTTLQDDER